VSVYARSVLPRLINLAMQNPAARAERARFLPRASGTVGRLLFVEHGWSPDPGVRAWQDRLDRLWSRLAGGCHLNRKMDALIADAGFELAELETGYAPGPKPLAYLYRGVARRAA